jgi:hypothetical protein
LSNIAFTAANRGSGGGEEPSGGDVLRLIQIRLTPSLEKITPACQAKFAVRASPGFKFDKGPLESISETQSPQGEVHLSCEGRTAGEGEGFSLIVPVALPGW